MEKNVTVEIDHIVRAKVMHWVMSTKQEVSGFGKVIKVADNHYRVVSAMLLPQKNGKAHTDIEAEDIGKAMFLLKDEPGDLRWWWHSHQDMSVFWSGTDRATMKQLGAQGWFLNTVFNRKWESKTAVQIGKPFELLVDDLQLYIHTPLPEGEIEKWDAEFKANVTDVAPKWESEFGGGRKEKGQLDFLDRDLPSGSLTKKQRRALRKKGKIYIDGTVVNLLGGGTDTVSDDGPEERSWISANDIATACVICGLKYSCKCDPKFIEACEKIDESGNCWCCMGPFENCNCTEQQLLMEAVKYQKREVPS